MSIKDKCFYGKVLVYVNQELMFLWQGSGICQSGMNVSMVKFWNMYICQSGMNVLPSTKAIHKKILCLLCSNP